MDEELLTPSGIQSDRTSEQDATVQDLRVQPTTSASADASLVDTPDSDEQAPKRAKEDSLCSKKRKRCQSSLACILHRGSGASQGKLLPVLPKHWTAIARAKESRRARPRYETSGWAEIVDGLPESPSERSGYHFDCYKNFTAISSRVPCCDKDQDYAPEKIRPCVLRQALPKVKTTASVFPNICLFCDKEVKKVGGTKEKLINIETKNAEDSIKVDAASLEDEVLLIRIRDVDFIAKEVKYHGSCRREYRKRAERVSNIVTQQKGKGIAREAFDAIAEYVKVNIIDAQRAEFLTSVMEKYRAIIMEYNQEFAPERSQDIARKLLKRFRESLCMDSGNQKRGNILYSTKITLEIAVRNAFDMKSSNEEKITEAAYILRREILAIQKKELAEPLTAVSLHQGEGSPPTLLTTFFSSLYSGPDVRRGNTEDIKRRIISTASDALFITTNGRIKPSKHIEMGIALKSLTGSRQLVTLMNRFGHCINNDAIDVIESEMAMSVEVRGKTYPDSIQCSAELCTGFAWDNYDELSETLSGAGTLHDTFGICYQNFLERDPNESVRESSSSQESVSANVRNPRKRRKAVEATSELLPIRGKPAFAKFGYEEFDVKKPDSALEAEQRDFVWLISLHLLDDVPAWIGWNSLFTEDTLPRQKVAYMKNICLPPTRYDVVAETLRRTQKATQELGQRWGIVSYDLAVAKMAFELQASMSPEFDNLFVLPGGFHISLCYFSALGTFLEGSGIEHILTESTVIAPGSLSTFLRGRCYNRCKRIHVLLAAAMELLHLEMFVREEEQFPENVMDSVRMLNEKSNCNPENLISFVNSEQFKGLYDNYKAFVSKTLHGGLGLTAQFWMQYVELVKTYMLFSRASRTNDVEMHTYALDIFISLFFVTNHWNYAKWMVVYLLNLLNIDNSHPGLRDILEKGCFSIRRSEHSFSGSPIDLVLEQSVNCDAASRLTGISSLTNSESARQQWMITRAARAEVISNLKGKAGMGIIGKDTYAELQKFRIHRDNIDISKIMSAVKGTLNPFEIENDSNLYNIATGKAADEAIKEWLLQILVVGNNLKREFIEECKDDPKRISKPLKRRKIQNFASAAVKKRIRSATTDKIQEVKAGRDTFGRLLWIACSAKDIIDLEAVLSYPLSPIPMCMAHPDGTMNKTSKSVFFALLESKSTGKRAMPSFRAPCVIDAMFLLHCLPPDLPKHFGGIAREILSAGCRLSATEVHFVFDEYKENSIKVPERQLRQEGIESTFVITGADQIRVVSFSKLLLNVSFKKALPKFLVQQWTQSEHSDVIGERRIFVSYDGVCVILKVENGEIHSEFVPELNSTQEEADTKMILHLVFISKSKPGGSIIIRSSDTDVLVLALVHLKSMLDSDIWLEAGTSSNNTLRYINVNDIAEALGVPLCESLPGFHAFTGCDYTASFMRKGKKEPFQMLLKKEEYIKAFSALGNSMEVPEGVVNVLEAYTCSLYDRRSKCRDVNSLRLHFFDKTYRPKRGQGPLENIKGIDGSSFPPCKVELFMKIKRANYVSYLWKQAIVPRPEIPSPDGNGWTIEEGRIAISWNDGKIAPENLIQLILEKEELEDVNPDPFDLPWQPESDDDNEDLSQDE